MGTITNLAERRDVQEVVAPWPAIDKYPTVIGSSLSIGTVSAVCRLCTTGYRREYVDVLTELVERDGHAFSTLQQRFLPVAGADLTVEAAELEGADDARQERADEIRDFVQRALDRIPNRTARLLELCWGIYYGVSAQEVTWEAVTWGGKERVVPAEMSFVHSRRIMYPDPLSWEPRIWDQGAVRGWNDFAAAPTSQLFGLRPADYPGKFVMHVAKVRGDYPTRDGIGRNLIWLLALKGMVLRGAGQYIERYARPWPLGSYKTAEGSTGPRAASQTDIAQLEAVLTAIGNGTLLDGVLPDSVIANIVGPGTSAAKGGIIAHLPLLDWLNAEISKTVLTQTLTTEAGKRGSTMSANTHKESAREVARYDAKNLSNTLGRDLVTWLVRLNFPDDADLTPTVTLRPDQKPDPIDRIEVAAKAAAYGIPVDADKMGEELGLPLVEQERPEDAPPDWKAPPRRMAPVKLQELSALEVKPEDEEEETPAAVASPVVPGAMVAPAPVQPAGAPQQQTVPGGAAAPKET